MRKFAFIIALLTTCFPLLIATPVSSTTLNWPTAMDMARDSSQLPENYAGVVIFTVLQWLLLIFTFLAVISFVVSGIMFFVAGGDTTRAEKARKAVQYSIIGIVAGLSGYVVITFVDAIMRGRAQGP